MSAGTTLLVLAKEPVPGRVKTRLHPAFSPAEAARLAAAALADTLDAVRATPAARRVLVLAGRPGPWLPPGFEVQPQVAGGLDRRLAAALGGCAGPCLLVGMDTPQLTPALLDVGWGEVDAWFGPAADGGYWALGLRSPTPELAGRLLHGVPMSSIGTGAAQRDRLHAAGLRVGLLPMLRDVDTVTDADEVAALAPATRFARTLADLTRQPAAR
ncbi:MAG: DUF2064 domain-containing protein [Actinobacteria bacterium]|nr:DUF2064 domain-containing protein [Actinomycetota bacterium]